jgi:hypothetical protein
MSEQVLKAAFDHFINWSTKRQQFEALLDPNVQWVEADPELGPRTYQGKPDVMAHLDEIKEHVASASLVSVDQKAQGWQVRDNMQVHGHDLHCCISDIDFDGELIKRVVHCRGHDQMGPGPCG